MDKTKPLVHIIVDSCADFAPQILERLDVECIPFTYIVDGKEMQDDIWKSTSPKDFYRQLRKGVVASTCAVSPGAYLEIFEKAAQNGIPTLYLGMTSGLSTSINNAQIAADMLKEKYPDFELYVVDNLTPSAAGQLLAMEAVRQVRLGLGAEDLYHWVLDARYFVHGYFTLENFDQLAKGGRIPAAAQITGKLDIKPVLSYDLNGSLTLHGMCRGRKKALKSLLADFVEKHIDDPSLPIAIVNADAEKDAQWLEAQIRKVQNCDELVIVHSSVSPVLGCHVGAGMVAVCFWGQDRREQMGLTDRIATRVKKHLGR